MKSISFICFFLCLLVALPVILHKAHRFARSFTHGIACNARAPRGHIVNSGPRLTAAGLALLAANVDRSMDPILLPAFDGNTIHERVTAANASLFTEAYFSEPLTAYAVGFKDTNDIEATLEFYAPKVSVPRRFEYAEQTNIEEFLSETTDDQRAIRGDFKTVEYTETKTQAATVNRGLRMVVDLDQVADKANWEQDYTAKLLRRLRRNALRRAVALLSNAATNTGKTWDTTAGKDPDQDVISELVTGNTAAGVARNRVGYGDTSWAKRALSHRAQNTAGGFASALMTPDQLAQLLGVDQVLVSKERYASSASAKAEIVSNLVLMFNAMSGADVEDPSNIKRFVSPCEGGGDVRVYSRQLTAKLWEIVVEHYELTKITSTLGIRKFTVS